MKSWFITSNRWLIIICLLSALIFSSRNFVHAGTPGTLPEITISDLVVSPSEAQAGQAVTVSMTIKESANVSGIYEGTLTINGVVEEKKKKTIGPLAVTDLTFTVTKSQPGIYEVDLDGLKGSFSVTAAAVDTGKPADTAASKFPTLPVVAGVLGVVVIGAVFIYFLRNKRTSS